jgi:ATP-dependent Clp protease adapter protein ClpS
MQFNDTGHLTFMRMLPVRNAGHTNGQLMVRVFDCGDATLSRVIPPGTSLTTIPEFVPPGFIQGLEILNDDSTPMEFVVGVLSSHLGLSREDSVATMLAIHERGGALIATQSSGEAQKIAEKVTVQAGLSGYPLICRAVTLE